MVSALRLRATHQTGGPAEPSGGAGRPVDDAAHAGPSVPWRPHRAFALGRLRRWRWPRALSFRRFGLGVSIAGAMAASAIGGGLLATRQPPPAASTANAVVAAASVVDAASGGAHAPAAAHPAAPSEAAAKTSQATAPADLPSAVAVVGGGSSVAPGPVGATATVVAAAAAQPPSAASTETPPAADLTFGLDVNGDGIPDSLERFVRKAIDAPATRVAARRYYRVALPLAALAEQGEPLTAADQNAVFRAAECYLLSAAEDGLPNAPNLNDRASLASSAAARRMQALAEALVGFDYRVGGVRRQSCS